MYKCQCRWSQHQTCGRCPRTTLLRLGGQLKSPVLRFSYLLFRRSVLRAWIHFLFHPVSNCVPGVGNCKPQCRTCDAEGLTRSKPAWIRKEIHFSPIDKEIRIGPL